MMSGDDAPLCKHTEASTTARARSWRFIAAIGLLASAVACMVVAIVDDHVDADWYPPDWVLVPAVAAIGTAVALRIYGAEAGRPTARILGLVPLMISCAVVAAGLAALVEEHRSGVPGLGAAALVAGGTAGAAGGLVLLARLDVPKRRIDTTITVLVSVLVVGAVVLGAAGVAESLDHRVLDHDIAAEADVSPIPALVSEVAWSTTVPGVILDVIPAGTGAIARMYDGIVAIDGETGEIRWQYRHRGLSASEVTVSPDGSSVLLQMKRRGRDEHRAIGLDAVTGEVRFDLDLELDWFKGTDVTNDAFVATTDDGIVVHSLVNGDAIRDWEWTSAGSDCGHLDIYPTPSSFVVQCLNAESEYSLAAFDSTTGELLWRVPRNDLDIWDVQPVGDHVTAWISVRDWVDHPFDLVLGTERDPQFELPAEIGHDVAPRLRDGRYVWMTDEVVAVGDIGTGDVVSVERPADARLVDVVLDDAIVFRSDWTPGSNDQLVVIVVEVGGRTIEIEVESAAHEAELVSTPGAIMVFDRFDFQEVPDSTIVGLR